MNRESSSLSPPICPVVMQACGSGSVVEHFLAKEDVAGSNPASRSTYPGEGHTGRVSSQVSVYATYIRRRSQRVCRHTDMLVHTAHTIQHKLLLWGGLWIDSDCLLRFPQSIHKEILAFRRVRDVSLQPWIFECIHQVDVLSSINTSHKEYT